MKNQLRSVGLTLTYSYIVLLNTSFQRWSSQM